MAGDFSLSWNIESLNQAYKQGYMCGVMGSDTGKRPEMSDVMLAAWEAGWEDGNEIALDDSPPNIQIAS